MKEYKRLKDNIAILKAHNETHKPVLYITGGQIHEIDLINEIVSDTQNLIDKIENGTLKEVIRCKNCKWFNTGGCAIEIIDNSDKPTENDFCSFAELKELQNERFYK